MKRLAAMVAVLFFVAQGLAFAHHCFVANKPTGAGSAGTLTLDVVNETESFDANLNPAGKPRGGFVTTEVTAAGLPLFSGDTFAHKTLPDGAMNSGPGNSACDGVGIDDAMACGQ